MQQADTPMRVTLTGAERAAGVTTGHLGMQQPDATPDAVSGDYSADCDMERDHRHPYFARVDPVIDRFVSELLDIVESMIGETERYRDIISNNDDLINDLSQEVDRLTIQQTTLLRLLDKD